MVEPSGTITTVDSADIVSNEVYEAELTNIFRKTWNFLAHESEIPKPGDFVVRYIGYDSIIVTRSDDGQVRAFYNVCRHRGMKVCRADLGTTQRFVCPYHGWQYGVDGRQVSVPLEKPYFGPEGLDRAALSLVPLERLELYRGLIFGSQDPDCADLVDFLGDLRWYLDIHLARDPDGLEVVGEPQRWIIGSNWKVGSENTSGDTYHAGFTHRSVMEVGLHPNRRTDFLAGGTRNGVNVNAGPGTMSFLRQHARDRGYAKPGQTDLFATTLPEGQASLLFGEQPFWPTRCHLFPNLSILNLASYIDEGVLVPFLNCRVWRPLGPNQVEVWSWVLIEASATEEMRQNAMRAYVLTFGASGTEEQDDVENFSGIAEALAGRTSAQIPQVLIMNGDLDPSWAADDWPGPGAATNTTYTDAGNRYFWQLWRSFMRELETDGAPR